MYAWQRYGVKPDIMTTAKALGCGVPVGAFLMTEKVGTHSLTSGDHGTTYGGNPLACAAICKVFELFEKEGVLENVKQVGPYLGERLKELADVYKRQTYHKTQMLCLVAERIHPEEAADASAGKGGQEEIGFRNPVAPSARTPRFNAHLVKTRYIHYYNIRSQNENNIHLNFPCFRVPDASLRAPWRKGQRD